MMVKVREYKEKDKGGVIRLVKEVLFEIFKVEAKGLEDLEKIKEEYFEKGGVFYVVEDRRKIIGAAAVKKEKEGVARLKRMYVDKEYRRKGIGEKILNKIIKFCKDKNYKKIILSTFPQAKEGIKFYKKRGFKEIKRNKEIYFSKTL